MDTLRASLQRQETAAEKLLMHGKTLIMAAGLSQASPGADFIPSLGDGPICNQQPPVPRTDGASRSYLEAISTFSFSCRGTLARVDDRLSSP